MVDHSPTRYMGFTGVVGHEFVGIVEKIAGSDGSDGDEGSQHSHLVGKRVVGEINLGGARRLCLRK